MSEFRKPSVRSYLWAVVLAIALLPAAGCGSGDNDTPGDASASDSGPRAAETTDAAADPLAQGLPAVLDFGRGQCVPCKKMAPILAELADEYRGRAVIRVIDITEPEGRALSGKYGIRLIPTQIFFDREGNEIWRHEGFLPREDIVSKLEEMGVARS